MGSTGLAMGLRKSKAPRHLLSCPAPLPQPPHTVLNERRRAETPAEERGGTLSLPTLSTQTC